MHINEDIQLAEDSLKLIGKDLRIEEPLPQLMEPDPFAGLLEYLISMIRYLLDHDFSRLMNAMYRVDVPEQKVSEILEQSAPDKIALNLALAIIEREKAKVLTRRKYAP